MIADNGMRQRDARIDNAHHKAKGDALYDKTALKSVKFFRPEDFSFNDRDTATCPAGKTLTRNGSIYAQRGHRFQRYEARGEDCAACHLRARCLRNPKADRGRQVARFAVAALLPGAQHRKDCALRVAGAVACAGRAGPASAH